MRPLCEITRPSMWLAWPKQASHCNGSRALHSHWSWWCDPYPAMSKSSVSNSSGTLCICYSYSPSLACLQLHTMNCGKENRLAHVIHRKIKFSTLIKKLSTFLFFLNIVMLEFTIPKKIYSPTNQNLISSWIYKNIMNRSNPKLFPRCLESRQWPWHTHQSSCMVSI